jgi:hypothetical protein
MEDGSTYPMALWTQPRLVRNSSLTGVFPALLIQSGDRLRAEVGCLAGHEDCHVAIDIYYAVFGDDDYDPLIPTHTEVYDGVIHTIYDQPIDMFANNYISFGFQVASLSNPEDSAIAWVSLEVYR